MTVTLVHVYVKPEYIEPFIEATRRNHEQSINESGNLRFDILQDANDKGKFVLYEAYESEAAAASHKNTSHYATWRDAVGPWMLKPREGVRHTLLFPAKF